MVIHKIYSVLHVTTANKSSDVTLTRNPSKTTTPWWRTCQALSGFRRVADDNDFNHTIKCLPRYHSNSMQNERSGERRRKLGHQSRPSRTARRNLQRAHRHGATWSLTKVTSHVPGPVCDLPPCTLVPHLLDAGYHFDSCLCRCSLSVVSAASCRHPSLPRLAGFRRLRAPPAHALSHRLPPAAPLAAGCLTFKARGYGNRRGNAPRPALLPIDAAIAASD